MKTTSTANFGRLVVLTLLGFGTPALTHAGSTVASWGANHYGQRTAPSEATNLKAIAAGDWHSLALRADGRVVAWGQNSYGKASVPAGLSNVVAIAAGGDFNVALRANGTVVAWGDNDAGQTDVPAGLTDVIAVAAGGNHALALTARGTVIAWGFNSSGQRNVPPGLSNVTAVAAGAQHSIAVKADGTLAAWGDNLYGQSTIPPGLSNVVAVAASRHNLALKADGTVVAWGQHNSGLTNVPPGLINVVAISANVGHSLALKSDGTVVAWGGAYSGATAVPAGLANAKAIAAGYDCSLALVFDGPPEILEQPTNANVPLQSNIVLSVVARGFEPLRYSWFFNGSPLADGTRISGATNATLTISTAQFSDTGNYSVIVSNGLGVVQSTGAVLTVISPPIITLQPVGRTVIAGTNMTLTGAAIGTSPLSYQWLLDGTPIPAKTGTSLTLSNVQSSQSGNYSLQVTNVYGMTESSNALVTVLESPPYILTQPTNRSATLGGNAGFSVNARGSTPLSYQWRLNGTDIPGATNTALTLGSLRLDQAGFYTVTISNALGSVVSTKAYLAVSQVTVWGNSLLGGLTNYPPGLTNVIAVSAGDAHVLALKTDGTVLAWGTPVPQRFPLVTNVPPTNVPPDLGSVVAIAAGALHSLALKADGGIVAWGDNSYGQIAVPAGLSNVTAIAAGETHSLALRSDGRVVAWGGALNRFRPPYPPSSLTNVPAGLSNVIAIAAGRQHNLALKNDGTLVQWGYVSTTNLTSGISNVVAIASGKGSDYDVATDDFNLALRTDGSVVSWGVGRRSFPQQLTVMPGVSNGVAIAASTARLALRADGRVVIWGSPTPVTGYSNVIAIETGGPPSLGYSVWGGPPPFYVAVMGDGSPFFTLQPAGQTVARGGGVQFHARTTGVQPLHYQWQLGGMNLSGATNASLTLTNVQGRDAGVYRAIVSNALGTSTSATATLTIPFSTNLAAALNATNLVWTTSATNALWFAQILETHDGDVATQSGRIGHNQQSILQTTTILGPGTLSFWWKVSSEEGYDFLSFFANAPDFAPITERISGETGWQQHTVFLPMGASELRWVYSKDATVNAGRDAGWLDEVTFTPTAPLVLNATQLLPDGSFVFVLGGAVGGNLLPEHLAFIEVQASTNLQDWITLAGACTLTNGLLRIHDVACTNFPQRFYRIVER